MVRYLMTRNPAHARAAIEEGETAVRLYAENNEPALAAAASYSLGKRYEMLRGTLASTETAEKAAICYERAGKFYGRRKHGERRALAFFNLGRMRMEQAWGDPESAYWEDALAAFDQCLLEWTKHTDPQQWTAVLVEAGIVWTQKNDLQQAARVYRDALTACSRDRFPKVWAWLTMLNCANLLQRVFDKPDPASLRAAIAGLPRRQDLDRARADDHLRRSCQVEREYWSSEILASFVGADFVSIFASGNTSNGLENCLYLINLTVPSPLMVHWLRTQTEFFAAFDICSGIYGPLRPSHYVHYGE